MSSSTAPTPTPIATFLIDLQRERTMGDDGPAHRFLKWSPDAELFLSAIALGEFAEGFDQAEHPVVSPCGRETPWFPWTTKPRCSTRGCCVSNVGGEN